VGRSPGVGFLGWTKEGDRERSTIRNLEKQGKNQQKRVRNVVLLHHVVTFQAVVEAGTARRELGAVPRTDGHRGVRPVVRDQPAGAQEGAGHEHGQQGPPLRERDCWPGPGTGKNIRTAANFVRVSFSVPGLEKGSFLCYFA
jgi:hypothetical protein